MEDSMNEILLFRFFARETSEKEDQEVYKWVTQSKENSERFKKSHDLYYLTNGLAIESNIDLEKSWNKLINQFPKNTNKSKVVYFENLHRIAIAILLIFAIGLGSLWGYEHLSIPNNTAVQFVVPKGEKSKVVLSDGSVVWLNSQSKLEYNPLKPREVGLFGEAYFEVKKDKRHPFLVSTNAGIKVRVTGTKFNLRSFVDEPYVETTLEEGEVYITSASLKQSVKLEPGEQAVYKIRDNQFSIKNVSAEVYSVWRKNEMRFEDVTLKDIIPQIERWYGVNITTSKAFDNSSLITMTVKTESLRELMEMLKLTSNFNYEIDGSNVRIIAK